MPLRATKNTYAYERVGPGSSVIKRKVLAHQYVGPTWFGDPECTAPVDGVEDQPEVYGNTTAPASAKYGIPVGPVSEVDGVTPANLPLSTAPPFDLTVDGTFDPEGEYEVAIISKDYQWTITPSPHGEGGAVVAAVNRLTATFAVPPDANNPGQGKVQVKDLGSQQVVGAVPFTWDAGTETQARGKPKEEPKDVAESAAETSKSAAETAEKAEQTAEKAAPQKAHARRRAPDE